MSKLEPKATLIPVEVRLSRDILAKLDKMRTLEPYQPSRAAWIREAIMEQMKRKPIAP